MFVNSTHLPQRLQPEDYVSDSVYQRELTDLFLPGWHCVATMPQIPRVGDFCTLDILGRPLIIWHTAEGIRTYLNVCAHRFCQLTSQSSGHADNAIKCQYHGWEYDSTGNTCRIPDAQSFRPLVKGELGLREYCTGVVGQLIFVSFSADSAPLHDFLGPQIVSLFEQWFGSDARYLTTVDLKLECNWKITIENVLESYHVETVHSRTFARYPDAEHCQHSFYENHDHYVHDYAHESGNLMTLPERFVAWLGGIPAELNWHHLLRYPNIVIGKGGPVAYVQMIWPLSATTCRSYSLFMDRIGPRGRIGSELAHWLIKVQGSSFIRRVFNEDARLYPHIQRGTAASDRPHGGGLISIREERIFAFQDRILKSKNEPREGCRIE